MERGCADRKDDMFIVPKDIVYDTGEGGGSFSFARPPTSRTPTSISTTCGIDKDAPSVPAWRRSGELRAASRWA